MMNTLSVFWTPRAAFDGVITGQKSLVSIFLFIIVTQFLASVLLWPELNQAVHESLANQASSGIGSSTVITIIAVLVGTLSSIVILASITVLLALTSAIFDGTGKFHHILGVLALASIPSTFASVEKSLLYRLGVTDNPESGVSTIGSYINVESGDMWAHVTNSISIFDVWTFVLVVFGFALVSGMSKRLAYVVGALGWSGINLFMLRIAYLGGQTL